MTVEDDHIGFTGARCLIDDRLNAGPGTVRAIELADGEWSAWRAPGVYLEVELPDLVMRHTRGDDGHAADGHGQERRHHGDEPAAQCGEDPHQATSL